MFRRSLPALPPEDGPMTDPAQSLNLRSVYAELSINFQYGTRAGLKHAGGTLEGY
jgi:hypothetical protein